MRGRFLVEPGELQFTAQSAWFERPQLREAVAWAEPRGLLLPASEPAGAETLALSETFWARLGAEPDEDSESRDRWLVEHEYVCALLGVGAERLLLRAVGYVRNPALKFELEHNGVSVDLTASDAFQVRAGADYAQTLSPVAGVAVQLLREFNALGTSSIGQQAALIAKLQRVRARAALTADGSRSTEVELAEHLLQFAVREPQQFRAAWTQDGKQRASLQLFVEGEELPLEVDRIDGAAPVVSRQRGGQTELLLLDEGTAGLARAARKLKARRIDRLDPEQLRSPLAVIPAGLETPKVDYSEFALDDFSHRVLGFEEVKSATQDFAMASGTEWFQRPDAGAHGFGVSATGPDGAVVDLRFDSAEAALSAAALVERALASGRKLVRVQGRPVQVNALLAERLRKAPEIYARFGEKPLGPEELAAQQGVAAPAAVGPEVPRLRPVLADISSRPGALDGVSVIHEDTVPWPLLRARLRDEVQLKDHQRKGLAWLWQRYVTGHSGALLADDMGLGKTLQIACLMALVKAKPRGARGERPALIVAPVVLIDNWRNELQRFFRADSGFPGRIWQLSGASMKGVLNRAGEIEPTTAAGWDIVITNYECLARYSRALLQVDWDVVVLDEAHRIKNRGTQVSLAARGLSGRDEGDRPRKFDFGICATGTPIENQLDDLWALYDFCSPGQPFGGYDDFRTQLKGVDDPTGLLRDKLHIGAAASALLRREKSAATVGLPPKRFETRTVPMTLEQLDMERALVQGRMHKRGGALGIIQGLQAIYQHPWLLEPERLQAQMDTLVAASPKLALCVDILREVQERGEKALVFTQWTRMQGILQLVLAACFRLGVVRVINGDPQNRQAAQQFIQEFSEAPGFNVMVLSPLAAGTGLNIQAANHVIHYGRWWNPAKEDQATDRAYRIGQQRPVTVYYPVVHHPGQPEEGFDVKLDQLVQRKRDMARDFLSPAVDGDLSQRELGLLGLREHKGAA